MYCSTHLKPRPKLVLLTATLPASEKVASEYDRLTWWLKWCCCIEVATWRARKLIRRSRQPQWFAPCHVWQAAVRAGLRWWLSAQC